jgi:hypothetical protein
MRYFFKLLFICFLAVSFFFNASNVMAYAPEDVSLEWNANTEDDLEGYMIYRTGTSNQYVLGGESSPNFISRIPCGPLDETCTNHTDFNLPAGVYFWVATAYDTDDNESGPSNQVTHTISNPPDVTPPESPTGLHLVAG